MSKDNILQKTTVDISAELSNTDILKLIYNSLNNIPKLFSYLIYANYKKGTFVGWSIEYNISQQDSLNTLNTCEIYYDLFAAILNSRNSKKHVVSYKQPPVELLLDLYLPLMKKLALEQSNKWRNIEYADALSMCKLTMLKLYYKGYYIHKYLLKRAFENDILLHLRHEINKPIILSLDQPIYLSAKDDDPVLLGDTIEDSAAELLQEESEENEIFTAIFNEVKSMIIELIGERQFEQLLRDYGNKHTTTWSRKKMQELKRKFDKLGITWKLFERYYQ